MFSWPYCHLKRITDYSVIPKGQLDFDFPEEELELKGFNKIRS